MANRNIQAKVLKMKRMRRNLPKRFDASYIPVGTGPNKFVLDEYKARTLSLAFDPTYLQALERKTKFKNVPPGKVEMRETLERMKTEGYQMLINFSIISNIYQRVRIFRNAEGTAFKICHEDFKGKFIRWSIEYPSKERAMTVWHTGKAVFIERASLSS